MYTYRCGWGYSNRESIYILCTNDCWLKAHDVSIRIIDKKVSRCVVSLFLLIISIRDRKQNRLVMKLKSTDNEMCHVLN